MIVFYIKKSESTLYYMQNNVKYSTLSRDNVYSKLNELKNNKMFKKYEVYFNDFNKIIL